MARWSVRPSLLPITKLTVHVTSGNLENTVECLIRLRPVGVGAHKAICDSAGANLVDSSASSRPTIVTLAHSETYAAKSDARRCASSIEGPGGRRHDH